MSKVVTERPYFCHQIKFRIMNALIGLLGTLLEGFVWIVVLAVVAIVYLYRWLKKQSTQSDEPQIYTGRQSDNKAEVKPEDDCYDEDAGCFYGYPEDRQFCVNCDLIEQCRGIPSPREKKHDEHDVISDFFMFNHLLDSDDKHDEKEHHAHDSFNCDNSWCECHENDGYSWFDENGDENDACW